MASVEKTGPFRPLQDIVFTPSPRGTGYSLEGRDFLANILETGDVYFGIIPGEDLSRVFPTAVFVTRDEFGERPKSIYRAEVNPATKEVISRTKIDCSLGKPRVYLSHESDKLRYVYPEFAPPTVGYIHPFTGKEVPAKDLWVVIYDVWATDEKWNPVERKQVIRQVTRFPKADPEAGGFQGNKIVFEESVFEKRKGQKRKGQRRRVVWEEKRRTVFLGRKGFLFTPGNDGILGLTEGTEVPKGIHTGIGRARTITYNDSLSKASVG